VIGWSIADHMRTSLVTDAVEMAVAARGGRVHDVVLHTDRGAQYGSAAFAKVCHRYGIRRRMGRVNSSYDNTLATSFFQSLKHELLHGGAGPRRRRHGWSCSGGCRTTTGAATTPPSATSRQPNTNSN
jgi:transposase InsO family protein